MQQGINGTENRYNIEEALDEPFLCNEGTNRMPFCSISSDISSPIKQSPGNTSDSKGEASVRHGDKKDRGLSFIHENNLSYRNHCEAPGPTPNNSPFTRRTINFKQ